MLPENVNRYSDLFLEVFCKREAFCEIRFLFLFL